MNITEIDTPALIVDLDIMERNLHKMAEYCHAHNIALRPHTKTHKTPEIAQLQVASGAVGITCAKVGEAEVMVDGGLTDILIAYPVWGQQKLNRLTALAKKARISVAMDSLEIAQGISEQAKSAGVTIDLLIELDVGLRRCGLSKVDDVVALAEAIKILPGVTFKGFMAHASHIVRYKEWDQEIARISNTFQTCKEALSTEGIPVRVISCGATPTAFRSHEFSGVTEIRAGTYLFCDMVTAERSGWSIADCAVSVLVTVVSMTVPEQIVIDGGSKTFASDLWSYGDIRGYGYCMTDPGLAFSRITEEHGIVSLSKAQRSHHLGDRLRFIPNHVSPIVNLSDRLYGVRKEVVEKVWTITGRGKVQ